MLEVRGGEGSPGERRETPCFFVLRDSLACFLRCYAQPRPQNLTPTANSPQSAEQFTDPDAGPGRPAALHPALPPAELQPRSGARGPGLLPGREATPRLRRPGTPTSDRVRIPQDHRVRRRHSLQLRVSTSGSLGPHLPGAVRSHRPPPPLGRSARLQAPEPRHQPRSGAHRYSGAPKPGGGAGPGRGRSARKVSASGTSSSPRANESLHNFVSTARESALLSARARTHTHLHTQSHAFTYTHFRASTYTHRARLKTSARSVLFPRVPLSS